MNFKRIIALSLSSVVITSCSLFTYREWSWNNSTSNDTISYCQLIGQLDHNDSMLRTKGVRDQLGTRVDEAYRQDNYNSEDTKIGEIILGVKDDGTTPLDASVTPHKFKIKQLEALEQKSMSGATWDPITANNSAATWISKHGKNITFFVSNNDGMSEGAIKATNWYKNMPIFGYDANTSAIRLINQERIVGTVDSNTVGQCLASSVLIRNIINANKTGLIKKMWDGTDGFQANSIYNPIREGFSFQASDAEYSSYGKETDLDTNVTYNQLSYGTGYIHSAITFDGCKDEDIDADKAHAIYLQSRTVTKFDNDNDNWMKNSGADLNAVSTKFFFKDGSDEAKSHEEFYNQSEYGGVKNPITPNSGLEPIRLWQCWYSNTDVFFTGNMDPYFALTQSSSANICGNNVPMFNLTVTPASSDGADEKKLLDALKSALSGTKKPEAYLINVVQQPNCHEYLKTIAEYMGLNEKDSWGERSDIPIVFWNRQPTNSSGQISTDVMHNKWFKYTYYIGMNASEGGQLQGKMIKAWLNKTYVENQKGAN